jgi:hypothetical protein
MYMHGDEKRILKADGPPHMLLIGMSLMHIEHMEVRSRISRTKR